MELRSKSLRIAVAVGSAAVLAVGSTLVATSSEAAPASNQQSSALSAAGVSSAAAQTAAAARLEQCLWLQTKPVGNGWAIPVPSVWESGSTNCNLKYGDMPRRYGPDYVGDPEPGIKALQRNLNYCYGSKLVVDGKFGSKTRAAVQNVQRRHKITVDGVYGPQTRSAMNWRLYNPAKKIWSSACYSPI